MVVNIRKKFIGLFLCVFLLVSVGSVQAQNGHLPENMDVHVSLELNPDGSFQLAATADGPMSGEIGQLPITSAQGHVEISSPSSGLIKIKLDGSVTLSDEILAELPEEIHTALNAANAETINSYIELMQIEGKPIQDIFSGLVGTQGLPYGEGETEMLPEMENFIIENINCTKFSWKEPALELGLDVILSGRVFENEELRSSLSVVIDMSLESEEGSLTLSVDASGPNAESHMRLSITTAENGLNLSASIEAQGQILGFEEGEPYSFQLPPEVQEVLGQQSLTEWFEGQNISFELKVPEGAEVTGLPGNPSYSGGTYSWTGGSAAEAVGSFLSGQSSPRVNLAPAGTPGGEQPGTGGPGAGGEWLVWVLVGAGIAVTVAIIVVVALRRLR
jgi:hypothetical protein